MKKCEVQASSYAVVDPLGDWNGWWLDDGWMKRHDFESSREEVPEDSPSSGSSRRKRAPLARDPSADIFPTSDARLNSIGDKVHGTRYSTGK